VPTTPPPHAVKLGHCAGNTTGPPFGFPGPLSPLVMLPSLPEFGPPSPPPLLTVAEQAAVESTAKRPRIEKERVRIEDLRIPSFQGACRSDTAKIPSKSARRCVTHDARATSS